MPYSKKETKDRALRLVRTQEAKAGRSALGYFLFLFAIPVVLYVAFRVSANSNFEILSDSAKVMKSGFLGLRERARPYLDIANTYVFNFAEDNEGEIQTLAAKMPATTAAATSLVPRPETVSVQEAIASQKNDVVDAMTMPLDFASRDYNRQDILEDHANRVPEVFKIPTSLQKRIGFWLDIYSRYSSRYHVIHHVEYPWIVYKVIDTQKVLSGSENRWTKYHRAQGLVRKEIAKVRQDLYALARMKVLNVNRLNDDQRRYAEILNEVPGDRRRVFARAASQIREQLGQKDFFRKGLTSGSKYLPHMEEIFAQYDLPVELTRLPLVESSFNEDAISKVGASGIWQFMPVVGKQYLKVNELIDERNSPLKATEAAAKLMMLNFKITQSWPLAITAYNHGANGIVRASKKAHTNDLATIIEKYRSGSFGFASSNFFTSFLAALHAERYQEVIFGNVPKYPVHRSDMMKLTQAFKAGVLARVAGITMEELRLYNPDLKRRAVRENTVLPKNYRVFLPQGRKARIEMYVLESRQKPKSKFRVSSR